MSIRLKDTIYNTANYSTDSDKLDGYNSTHYVQYKSAATPATAQWYRIAQTVSGISNNIGNFYIYGSAAGAHTDVVIEAGTSYGNTAGTTLVQTSCAAFSALSLTKARIVYHTSYTDNYAYLEVYLSSAKATNIYVKFQGLGWTLVAPNTVGSIPSGYSTKEITFTKDAVVAPTFVGALSGNASTATLATTATSANKLNTNAGGTTTPVYFTGGVPTACSVASTASTASTIAVRDGSGDIYARLIRQTYADQSTISGGIVYRVNNSSDNYLRVCNSTTAIRSFLGVPSTSDLGAYLPRLRMTNPDPGHASVGAIPFIFALKAAGTPVYKDPEFKDGNNSVAVYNNSGNGAVTVTRITDNQNSANSSGYILQISTTESTASPGRGGFCQTMTSRAGAVFCQIFRAKIPIGFTLANNENSMGSEYKTYWMTNKAGTGKWEWYCRITICGTSGTFSSGGHVSLSANDGGTSAVTWYLSYCNLIDLTKANYDGLRSTYSDTATKLGSNAGSATNPIYFSGGKPVACTYSLNKTVPSDAIFTDTTYSTATSSTLGLVKIGYTQNGKNYPIQLSNGQMYVNVPWTDTDTNTTYSTATSTTLGLVKIGYTQSGKNYPVKLSNGQMYVNVPWTDTDTNTTYSTATSSTLGLVKIGYTQNGKNYPVQLSNGQMYVNVPWTDTNTNTTYSTATSSTLGLVKIGYTQSGKNYPVQLSNGQMYVNVPWTDTDTNTDTKNTAGSTNSSSKLFLIGATSQAANPQTYSHDTAYVGTDGCLYSNSTKVSVEGHAHTYYWANLEVSTSSSATTIPTFARVNISSSNVNLDLLSIQNTSSGGCISATNGSGNCAYLYSSSTTTSATASATLCVSTGTSGGYAFYCTGKAYISSTLTQNSDRSLKYNIQELLKQNDLLDKIDNIPVVSFNMINSGEKKYGFIAQDFLPDFSEVTDYNGDQKTYSLDYNSCFALKIAALERRIKMLEEKLKEVNILF
jgi:hypothetical protein